MKKCPPTGDVEFVITVKENRAFHRVLLGPTLLVAPPECIKSVHRLLYEPVS